MTDDIHERLARLEADHTEQRRRWVAKAAEHAGFHDADMAVKLVDPASIVTSGDADRAVADLLEQRPYLNQELISVEEQHRRWGAEILEQLENS
jgi:hypothetical protein